MLDASERDDLLRRVGKDTRARFRLYGPDGRLVEDSWRGAEPTYRLRDPAIEPWRKDLARATDRAFNRLVGEKPLDDYVEPARDIASAWPEIVAAHYPRPGGHVDESEDLLAPF